MRLFHGWIDLVPSRGGHLVQRSHRHQWRGYFYVHLEERCHVFLFVFTGDGGRCGSHGTWYGAWTVVGVENRRVSFIVVWFRSLCWRSQTVVVLEDFTVTIPFRKTIFDPFGFIFLAIACITHKKENIPEFFGGWRPFRTIGGSLMIFGCVASVLRQCTCKKIVLIRPANPVNIVSISVDIGGGCTWHFGVVEEQFGRVHGQNNRRRALFRSFGQSRCDRHRRVQVVCPTRNRDGLNRLLNGNRNKVYEHVVMVRGRVFDAFYKVHSKAAWHFDPSFHCLFWAEPAVRVKTN